MLIKGPHFDNSGDQTFTNALRAVALLAYKAGYSPPLIFIAITSAFLTGAAGYEIDSSLTDPDLLQTNNLEPTGLTPDLD